MYAGVYVKQPCLTFCMLQATLACRRADMKFYTQSKLISIHVIICIILLAYSPINHAINR